jgi:hypothetical protein
MHERGGEVETSVEACGRLLAIVRKAKDSVCFWILTLSPTLLLPAQVIEPYDYGPASSEPRDCRWLAVDRSQLAP